MKMKSIPTVGDLVSSSLWLVFLPVVHPPLQERFEFSFPLWGGKLEVG
jgi:hypothetical protein